MCKQKFKTFIFEFNNGTNYILLYTFTMGLCSSCVKSDKDADRPSSPIQSGVVNIEKKETVKKSRSVSFRGESKEQVQSRLSIKKGVARNASIMSNKSLTIPEETRSRAPTIVINEALDDGDEIARDL